MEWKAQRRGGDRVRVGNVPFTNRTHCYVSNTGEEGGDNKRTVQEIESSDHKEGTHGTLANFVAWNGRLMKQAIISGDVSRMSRLQARP